MSRATIISVTMLLATTAFAAPGGFTLNSDGANGNEDPLRFTVSALAAAFPDLRVETYDGDNVFGGGGSMMALMDGDTTVFIADRAQMERAYTFSIFTRSDVVIGPNGWRVGASVLADVVGQDGWDCGRGYNEQAYRVSCMNWDESLRLLFEEQSDISTDTVGPEFYDAVLGGAVLEEMRQYLSRPVQ